MPGWLTNLSQNKTRKDVLGEIAQWESRRVFPGLHEALGSSPGTTERERERGLHFEDHLQKENPRSHHTIAGARSMGATNGGDAGQDRVLCFQVKHPLLSKKLTGNLVYDKQAGKLD